jgi:hypothetical protein
VLTVSTSLHSYSWSWWSFWCISNYDGNRASGSDSVFATITSLGGGGAGSSSNNALNGRFWWWFKIWKDGGSGTANQGFAGADGSAGLTG